ncbi:MAG: FHA domain-containing protein [Sedimentisphaerales bacterium]|nr:FHA domain-containing protein [Sedimentisphaerales bacterium]
MQLVVKQDGGGSNRLRFSAGPIHIGRGPNSQVFLPDMKVSRQHAVFFRLPEGDWMLQDLDSANKTYLNDKAIHKVKVETGDLVRIGDFTIEIDLDKEGESEQATKLEDTLVAVPRKVQVITRDLHADDSPDIRMPAGRAKDFLRATEDICNATGLDQVLQTLMTIMFRQFDASHVWCALRVEPAGPMTSHTGKSLHGGSLSLEDIGLNEKITYAVDNSLFMLFPSVSAECGGEEICSAMIGPVLDPDGCFGVFYLDNSGGDAAYELSDLDYLMLLAIHTAAIVENF